MEILIGKVQHVVNRTVREVADMMREFCADCASGKDVLVPVGEGNPPVGDSSPAPAELGNQPGVKLGFPRAGKESAAVEFDPPFDERGKHAGGEVASIPERQPQTLEEKKIWSRYQFWKKKTIESKGDSDTLALDKLKDAGRDAMRAGLLKPEEWGKAGVSNRIHLSEVATLSQEQIEKMDIETKAHPRKNLIAAVVSVPQTPRGNPQGKKVKKARLKTGKSDPSKAKRKR